MLFSSHSKLLIIYIFSLLLTSILSNSKEYSSLVSWLKSNGAFINPKLSIVESNKSNRFIKSSSKILKDETIIFIPEDASISITNKRIFPFCEKYLKYEPEANFYCLLFFLLSDFHNPKSFFLPYYNYLPQIDDTSFYLTLSDQEKSLFDKTEFIYHKDELTYLFDSTYMTISQYYPDRIYKKEFIKIYLFVTSRNIGRAHSKFPDINSIVPYLDLFNHNNNPNVGYYYDDVKNGFVLYALKNIYSGEELNIKYGKLSNDFLFRIYGFTLKNNEYKIPIRINMFNDTYIFHGIDMNKEINMVVSTITNKYKISKKLCVNEVKNAFYRKINIYERIKSSNVNLINIKTEVTFHLYKYIQIINDIYKN